MTLRGALSRCVLASVAIAGAASYTAAAAPSAPPQVAASTGPYSAAALYNQANGFAHAGKPGLAVLNYERARLLAPADPDTNANLRAVRESQHLDDPPTPGIERILALVGPMAAALLGLGGVLLVVGSAAAPPVLRSQRALRAALAVIGVTMCACTVAYGNMQWQSLHAAIVVTGDAPARASPVPMAGTLFTLAEGDMVHVAAKHNDYVLVKNRQGATGWVADTMVIEIVPAIAGRHDLFDW